MILWNWHKQEIEARARAEGYAEGYAEARAEIHKAWVEWNTRRIEAEKKNKRFDEPPPSEA